MKKFLAWVGVACVSFIVFPLLVAWATEWMKVNGYMPTSPTNYWGSFSRWWDEFSKWTYDYFSATFIYVLVPFAVVGFLAMLAILSSRFRAFLMNLFKASKRIVASTTPVISVDRDVATQSNAERFHLSGRTFATDAMVLTPSAHQELAAASVTANGKRVMRLFVDGATNVTREDIAVKLGWTVQNAARVAGFLRQSGFIRQVESARGQRTYVLTQQGELFVERLKRS